MGPEIVWNLKHQGRTNMPRIGEGTKVWDEKGLWGTAERAWRVR